MACAIAQVRRILFIRTDRLGETLLNLPAMAALKAACPDASLTLLVHPTLQPLLEGFPGVDRILVEPPSAKPSWWCHAFRLARILKPARFDLALISNPKKALHLAVWLSGIPRRVGYDRKWGWLLTDRLPDRKALGDRHEVDYNFDLIRALGLPAAAPQWQLPKFEAEQAKVIRALQRQGISSSEPFVVVHPWTSNPVKQWPLARFGQLVRALWQMLGVRTVIIGGEESIAQAPAVLPPGVPTANLVGQLTLRQLVGLLQRAALLISSDSGPVHLAAAAKSKTVVLFGTTTPATGPTRWGPWGMGHIVIWKPSMELITVDEVLAAVRHQLAASIE